MTISYQRDVASSTAGGFTRLLFKWKGSLYKLICRELLLFLIVYILLGVIYRQLMSPGQKELFENVVKYFDAFINLIPLSFVLGFYVSYVASRWWQQFLAIPWPDKLFHSIACYVEGFDEESRMLRRSLMRYMNLALILVLRSISSAVKQRFPTLDHVVEAGFMTTTEKELFSAVPANEFNTYWVPCTWFIYRLQEATKKGKLLNQYSLENIMREFCEFRAKCGLLWCFDWVSIPMVYTQVVTLATYVFFIFTIIGRQKIDNYNVHKAMRSGRIPLDIDLYIPVFTVLQFFFYMGLLKVAEQLINPFGDDDEDFELNWLIDRHVKASFLGCDILMNPERIPPMVKDYYWDKQDCPIPYTEASMHFKKKTYRGSADDMKVPEDKCHMVLPEIEEEEEEVEEGQKLSLTSLLLDGEAEYNLGSPLSYDRGGQAQRVRGGPAAPPGAWRNGAGSCRDTLMTERRGSESEEEEDERRGSIPFISSRRGSKLQDILKYNQEKRKKPRDKRYRDKQGFVWRRFVAEDDELPVSRAPHPKLPPAPSPARTASPPGSPASNRGRLPGEPAAARTPFLQSSPAATGAARLDYLDEAAGINSISQPGQHQPQQQQHQHIPRAKLLHPLSSQIEKVPSIDLEYLEPDDPTGGGSGVVETMILPPPPPLSARETSLPPDFSANFTAVDPETASLRSNRSEQSFQTCSSEPQLNLVPRQVSDTYSAPNERGAHERKASVRALKQQYSASNGPLLAHLQKQNRNV